MENYNLQRKVDLYKEVLENTEAYRLAWKQSLKSKIISELQTLSKQVGLPSKIEEKIQFENMEAVVLNLGTVKSGMSHKMEGGIELPLVKHNGSLIYQQLFNGKVIVIIQYPFIENYGQPRPPKTIAIYRPEEIQPPYLLRHLEEFVHELTTWEDYDDDEPSKKIGFEMNFGSLPKKEE